MESKEAVLELIIEAESPNRDDSRLCFLKKIIERDLEILEILKEHVAINKCIYDDTKMSNCIEIVILEGDMNYIKIKEWLESQIKMEELTEKEDIDLDNGKTWEG